MGKSRRETGEKETAHKGVLAIRGDMGGTTTRPHELFLVQWERIRYIRNGRSPRNWGIERYLQVGALIIPIQKFDHHLAAQSLDGDLQ